MDNTGDAQDRKPNRKRKQQVGKKRGIYTKETNVYVYEISNGQTFSINNLGDNLKTVFVEPNSEVMADLFTNGYQKEIRACGYTKDMKPKPNQEEVVSKKRLYSTSTGVLLKVSEIGDHLEKYYVEDNSTLITDLLNHGYDQKLIEQNINFSHPFSANDKVMYSLTNSLQCMAYT